MNIPYIFLEIDLFRDGDKPYFHVYKDVDEYISIESNYFWLQIFKVNPKFSYIRNRLLPRIFKYVPENPENGDIGLLRFSFMNIMIEMHTWRRDESKT